MLRYDLADSSIFLLFLLLSLFVLFFFFSVSSLLLLLLLLLPPSLSVSDAAVSLSMHPTKCQGSMSGSYHIKFSLKKSVERSLMTTRHMLLDQSRIVTPTLFSPSASTGTFRPPKSLMRYTVILGQLNLSDSAPFFSFFLFFSFSFSSASLFFLFSSSSFSFSFLLFLLFFFFCCCCCSAVSLLLLSPPHSGLRVSMTPIMSLAF